MDETVLLGHGSGGFMKHTAVPSCSKETMLLVLKLLRLESDWLILRTAL